MGFGFRLYLFPFLLGTPYRTMCLQRHTVPSKRACCTCLGFQTYLTHYKQILQFKTISVFASWTVSLANHRDHNGWLLFLRTSSMPRPVFFVGVARVACSAFIQVALQRTVQQLLSPSLRLVALSNHELATASGNAGWASGLGVALLKHTGGTLLVRTRTWS